VTYGRLKSLPETLKSLFTILAQFPKLDVAGSNPVSRSNFSMTYKTQLHSEHRLNTIKALYITRRLFSDLFTMSSLLSTGDCV
jgi:hypothetical protein